MSTALNSDKEVSDGSKVSEDPPILMRPAMKKTCHEVFMTATHVHGSHSYTGGEANSEILEALYGDFDEEDHIGRFDGNIKATFELTATHDVVNQTVQTRNESSHKEKGNTQEEMHTEAQKVIGKENGSSQTNHPVKAKFLSILGQLTTSTVNMGTHWVPLPKEFSYYQLFCQYFGSKNVSSSKFEEIYTATHDPECQKITMATYHDLLT